MVARITDQVRTDEIQAYVAEALDPIPLDGRSLCVIVPDATRSCPLPDLMGAVHSAVAARVARLTILIALGTHQPMDPARMDAHLGPVPGATVVNHEWWRPEAFAQLGTLSAEVVSEASEGRLLEPIDVRLNRAVVEHDVVLVVGPVFPHEVVGFSGGNKYFVPGIAGPEIIDVSHWLGALIGSATIIGTPGTTPVRRLIDRAAAMIPAERYGLACVVRSGTSQLEALAFGTPEQAWQEAARVSARTHIRYLDRPVARVLSCVSDRYDEIWTAAKGMYKVEAVVADGGEVVLYAPHVSEVSRTHGDQIRRIGYHCMEYFLGRPEHVADVPRGVLAHATHLRGQGTWSATDGERCRIRVTLATGLSEQATRDLGLGYQDPTSISEEIREIQRIQETQGTRVTSLSDSDTLVVPDAGEVLYRLA